MRFLSTKQRWHASRFRSEQDHNLWLFGRSMDQTGLDGQESSPDLPLPGSSRPSSKRSSVGKAGLMLVMFTLYYVSELFIIGPRTNVYPVAGILIVTTGYGYALFSIVCLVCGLPCGLLLMAVGGLMHRTNRAPQTV